jgi:HSP20 family molecular chaperone IbpA
MGVDDDFEEMRKMINRMLQDAFQGRPAPEHDPFVREFTGHARKADDDPEPQRRYVLRVPESLSLPGPEITENDGQVSVTFDLGDAAVLQVRTQLLGRLLYVDVEGPKPLRRVVELPCEVAPNVRWTVHNGVLDLVLPRAPGPDALS